MKMQPNDHKIKTFTKIKKSSCNVGVYGTQPQLVLHAAEKPFIFSSFTLKQLFQPSLSSNLGPTCFSPFSLPRHVEPLHPLAIKPTYFKANPCPTSTHWMSSSSLPFLLGLINLYFLMPISIYNYSLNKGLQPPPFVLCESDYCPFIIFPSSAH